MRTKYEGSTSNGSKVIANVKVDNRQTNRQTDRQTNKQTGQKQYAPDHSIRGHKKIIWKEGRNMSPKGHWSLTWVQWALLLKVRFLIKWLIRKHDCHICEISPNSKQSGYFNSGYEDAFGLLLLHSDLKKKSFGEWVPHWPIFCPALDPSLGRSGQKALTRVGPWLLHAYKVWSTSINLFCRKGYVFPSIYMH